MSEPVRTVLFPAARVAALEAQLDALRIRERLRLGALEIDEVAWLRRVVAQQESELERLRDQLRQVQAVRRRATLDALIRAVADALASGEAAMPGRSIAFARAELKVRLELGEDPGIAVGNAGDLTRDSLSTISLELRALPPTLEEEHRRTAAAAVIEAAAALQHALDDVPQAADTVTAAALAAASVLASAPAEPPDALPALARPLADALLALAARVDALTAPAREFADRLAAVATPPSGAEIAALSAPLREAADAVSRWQ